MAQLQVEIKKIQGKYVIKIDAEKFEQLADLFGFYNPDFLKVLKESIKEYKRGKIKNIKELYRKYKDLL
ncbi:MAG: hypothetical protein KatS3mg095_0705 [Candidatus Parcubacteria bacterium]|nr:MAG: hypothetical protein KatS3mg095_0705 [Candidatus Parcubacteria bacterium]